MAERRDERGRDPEMDSANLYREEIYTDRRVGTIRVLIPVTDTGATDAARKTIYAGEAQMLTQMGTLPLNFEIDAASLSEAVSRYSEAAKTAMEDTMRELEQMRREAASGLVIPRAGAGALGPGGGGLGGGGKIQLP